MIRLDPELFFALTVIIGAIHLLCALAVGVSLLREGSGPGWKRAREGLRWHSFAGLGLSAVAGIVAWRVSPGRVTAVQSWIMLLGLLAAGVGQIGLLRALAAGGALSPPAAGESRVPRVYIALSPLAVFVLVGLLFALRGVH